MAINTIHVAGINESYSSTDLVAITHNTDTKKVIFDGVAVETAKLKLLFDYLVKEEEELHG